jgi:hypothetical protein
MSLQVHATRLLLEKLQKEHAVEKEETAILVGCQQMMLEDLSVRLNALHAQLQAALGAAVSATTRTQVCRLHAIYTKCI